MTFVILARFDGASAGENHSAFYKCAPTAIDTNFQGESLEGEDYDCDAHFQQAPVLSFERKNASQFYFVEEIFQPEFSPRKPIILISCFRI